MADNKEQIRINTVDDFKRQLTTLKEDAMATLISYYKYCWLHDSDNDMKFYQELIEDELKEFGLTEYQYRVTEDLNFVFRFKKKVEALLYIKHFGVDVFFYKK